MRRGCEDIDFYFLVGIVNSDYLPQIFKAKDKDEACKKYSILYNLKKEEKSMIQLFRTFLSFEDVEKWLTEQRGSKDYKFE